MKKINIISMSLLTIVFLGVVFLLFTLLPHAPSQVGFVNLFLQIMEPLEENKSLLKQDKNDDDFKKAILYFADDPTGELIDQLDDSIEYIIENETNILDGSIFDTIKLFKDISKKLHYLRYCAINWENITIDEKNEARYTADMLLIQKHIEENYKYSEG